MGFWHAKLCAKNWKKALIMIWDEIFLKGIASRCIVSDWLKVIRKIVVPVT